MDQAENPLEDSDKEVAEELPLSEAERRLAEVMRRVAAGDTSAVSEVYWLQMLDLKKPPAH
jgi:hypothetical protein